MVFSSEIFLFAFLPLVFATYFLARGIWFRNFVLVMASLLFYSWGEGRYVVLILTSVVANYFLGRWVSAAPPRSRRLVLGAAVAFNLGLLVFFKYTNFFVDNMNFILSSTTGRQVQLSQVYLPLGISFFTFHALSYVIDVYRGKAVAQTRFERLALYFAFFPQLIAGPIIRYHDVYKQLTSRTVALEDVSVGATRFVAGLAKKVLIANTLGYRVDEIFAIPAAQLTPAMAWFGICAYTLQIYFDFSGYSDMAIGLARIFGFRFLENFNSPYIAQSLTEFWRRWHISLSNWFRDYLYIPLGGNRVAPWRVYLNLAVVFLLCGFWHGAKWNFVTWGAFHGLFLILERTGVLSPIVKSKIAVLRHSYLILVVVISWVFFRASTLTQAISYLGTMVGVHAGDGLTYHLSLFMDHETEFAFLAGIVLCVPFPVARARRLFQSLRLSAQVALVGRLALASARLCAICGVFLLTVSKLAAGTYNPFIYFRF